MEKDKIESGGEFLIKETNANDIFIPEDLNEEQQMIIETCEGFLETEIFPNLDRIDAQEDGYFTGGHIIFGDETRTIVDHVGSIVTIMYKFKELEDNDSVDAYPGCDGKIETCKDKFDNLLNFLGFPFIPVENPALRVSW